MLRLAILLTLVLVTGSVATGSGPRRPKPDDPEVLSRFAAIICRDLLYESEGELHRLDHLDSNEHVRVVLPMDLHPAFLNSADDLDLDLSHVELISAEQSGTRESGEPYLSFSVEKNEWAVWYKCLSLKHREPKDGPRTTGGYAESWWVSDDGNWFSYCFSHMS